MKKISLFALFSLLCSKTALADGGIPFILLISPLSFIALSYFFGFGLLLFFLVVFVETGVLIKSRVTQDITFKKVYLKVINANLLSTLAGVLLVVFSVFILYPVFKSVCPDVMCHLSFPAAIIFPANSNLSFILNMIICFLLSFWVEYWYLKKQIKNINLKRIVFVCNLVSYIVISSITFIFLNIQGGF